MPFRRIFDLDSPHVSTTALGSFLKLATIQYGNIDLSPLDDTANLIEDTRLQHWKKWLEARRRITDRLGKKLNRTTPSLVMNSIESVRRIREDKDVLEYTRIPAPPDPSRGGPDFWIVPESLSNLGNPCLPECFPILSDIDKGIIPKITYVDVPTLISKEKGVYGGNEFCKFRKPWEKSDYLEMRKCELEDQIKIIQPHKPVMDQLAIEGKMLKSPDIPPGGFIPVLSVSQCTESMKEDLFEESVSDSSIHSSHEYEKSTVVSLKIDHREVWYRPPARPNNNTRLFSDFRYSDSQTEWRISFDTTTKVKCERFLEFENIGTVTIQYYWKKHRTVDLDEVRNNVLKRSDGHFFFNKNSGGFKPGQIVRIPFWFHSRNPGTFQEQWELHTVPRLVPNYRHMQVTLWGLVRQDINPYHDTCRRIEEYLAACEKESTAREVAEEVCMVRHYQIPEPTYRSLFLEDELFNAMNPGYYYHPTVLETLKDLFVQVAMAPADKWDLNIKSLQRLILSTNNISKQEEYLGVLSKSAQAMLSPCVMTPIEGKKNKAAFSILCSFANAVDRDAENLRNIYGLTSLTTPVSRTQHKSIEISRRMTTTPERPKFKSGKARKNDTTESKKSSSQIMMASDDFLPKLEITEEDKRKKAKYLKVLFVKVYHHLGDAVEQLSAAIDSINYFEEIKKKKVKSVCQC